MISRSLTIALLIFISIGIRFIDFQGVLLSLLLIGLNLKSFNKISVKDKNRILFIVFFFIISMLFNYNQTDLRLVFVLMLFVFSAYSAIITYKSLPISILEDDIIRVLKLFSLHAFIGYILLLFFSDQFTRLEGTLNRSFMHMFFVSHSNWNGIPRNTGLFWEPGVMQLIPNLLFFYAVKNQLKFYWILLSILLIITAFSTTGFVVLFTNILYLIYVKSKNVRKNLILILVVLLSIGLFTSVIERDVQQKLDLENTSGLIRMRDIFLSWELIKEKPLFGHGIVDLDYIERKGYASNVEQSLFTEDYLKENGYMDGGFTNGFFGGIVFFGIPIGCWMFYLLYNNGIVGNGIENKLTFFCLMAISLFSEPILFTPLFAFLIISGRLTPSPSNKTA